MSELLTRLVALKPVLLADPDLHRFLVLIMNTKMRHVQDDTMWWLGPSAAAV